MGRRTRWSRAGALLVGALAAWTAVASPASAGDFDDPFLLNWPTFLPSVPGDYTPSTESDCTKGSVKCVDNVVKEMTRRNNRLACSHDAAFSFVYLRTTETYRRAVEDPNFFSDNAFVNHEDAVFAGYYFDAYDDFYRPNVADAPPAWRITFHAAGERTTTAMGDILLGMNAHINRDLPFVLHSIGLTKPDGTSRKPDHDRVNVMLNEAGKYMLTEAANRYDPTIDDGDVPGTTIDQTAFLALVQEWREEAWRKAEMLRDAPTLADQLSVAQWIEDDAASRALAIRTAYAYGPLDSSAARDAYCTAHWSAL